MLYSKKDIKGGMTSKGDEKQGHKFLNVRWLFLSKARDQFEMKNRSLAYNDSFDYGLSIVQ